MILLALALLAAPPPEPPADYDALLAQGVVLGREGKLDDAGAVFDRALALDPERPEAWVERGGLRFLERKYEPAVGDLERALRIREDAYTRDLLASSLHLAGRSEEALASWNRLGQPRLGSLEISGLAKTPDRIARRELSVQEGDLLTLDELRASRARLREAGVFDRVTLRPVPLGDGKADLEVALVERHGLFRSPVDFVASTAVNALQHRVVLRYSDLGGTGVSVGGQYRWEENRPELTLGLDWPRPFGLPVYLRLQSSRGRQAYELEEPLKRELRSADLALRHVFGAQTTGGLMLRLRDRSFDHLDPEARPGLVVGAEATLERRLLESHRNRVGLALRAFQALRPLGSDLSYARGTASLGWQLELAAPDGSSITPSTFAARALWAGATDRAPLDDVFAPGGSPEMELPLRAHSQTRHGALGALALARSVLLGNVELRQRVLDAAAGQLGLVVFLDGGRMTGVVQGPDRTLWDAGVGLRLAARGGPVIRLDWGHGLSDGSHALFVGLGQVF